MQYYDGQRVWLKPFHDHAEDEPHEGNCVGRQQAHIMGGLDEPSGTYVVSLHGVELEPGDDGIRELTAEQVERLVYEDPAIRTETWQNAVYVQDAVNFGAILASFVQAVGEIKKSEEFQKRGFQVLERHALVCLYLDKLVSLAHGYVDWEEDRYGEALTVARELGNQPTGTGL